MKSLFHRIIPLCPANTAIGVPVRTCDRSAGRRTGWAQGDFPTVFFFFTLLPLRADPQPAPAPLTAELLLRVLQERHMLVENKKWLLAAFEEQYEAYLGDWYSGAHGDLLAPITAGMAQAALPTTIDWGHGLSAYPGDTAMNSLTMEFQFILWNAVFRRV